MINYHCPDFWYGFNVYQKILSLYRDYPECFIENAQISKIFGSFPGMTWTGGIFDCNGKALLTDIEDTVQTFYEWNMPLKLTLTNPLLEKEDCYDRYCNAILTMCENNLNEILVASPILETYIRDKYPKYKINHSILATKEDKTLEQYLQECDQYNQIVLPRRLIKNWDFLNQIPMDKRHKFELLCTDPCPIDCPRLYTHYEDQAKAQMHLIKTGPHLKCSSFQNNIFPNFTNRKYQITLEEIQKNYLPNNFTEFKLSGRTDPVVIVLTLVPYLIKPEYHRDVYGLLL